MMRMWMVEPALMCRKHLLGEHVEIHMLVGCINKGKNIHGFLEKGLVEPQSVEKRHAELVREMVRRGYRHNSPLPAHQVKGMHSIVDWKRSLGELQRRCADCRAAQPIPL
jgi:hypothetical protein